jgi:uncharacterized membrane protein YfcA
VPLAVLGALVVGFSLGMLGAGGSILTVPVLTYVLGQEGKTAIASSLAIVAGISLLGALPYAHRREIDWRSAAWFGAPGMMGAWLGALVAERLTADAQLLLFASVMLVAAVRMLRPRAPDADDESKPGRRAGRPRIRLVSTGLLVGVVTGIVGVGGGFLIVPALVLLVRLGMRRAVGTSLVVIAANAFAGFVKQLGTLDSLQIRLDWRVIGVFVAVGGVGTLVGSSLGSRLSAARLRQGFGGVLACLATYMFFEERSALWALYEAIA